MMLVSLLCIELFLPNDARFYLLLPALEQAAVSIH